MRAIAIVTLLLLAGCAYTSMDATYDDGEGKTLTAHYVSFKDIEAPTFETERDPATGRIVRLYLSAKSSLASPVNAQTVELLAPVIAGVLQGLRASRMLLTPTEVQQLDAMPSVTTVPQSAIAAGISPASIGVVR